MNTFELTKGRITIWANVLVIGDDILIAVYGGDTPHIGSVSMAVPRPSLAAPDQSSATVSTYNFVGHLDDAIGDMIAKRLSSDLGRKVVVTCGIHIDAITLAEISDVRELCDRLCLELPAAAAL